MGIYVNNQLAYKVNGTSLSTNLTLAPGNYNTVVQEWDNCGGATTTSIPIVVSNGVRNGVTVTTPGAGSTVQSPVQFTASAGTTSCATGIAAMGIYVGNALQYKANGTTLNTQLAFASGPQQAVVQSWDNCGGALKATVGFSVATASAPTVQMTASSASITAGSSSVLTVTAANATSVVVTGSNGISYSLAPTGGSQTVTPAVTTTYTVTATGASSTATAAATVSVSPIINSLSLPQGPVGMGFVITGTGFDASAKVTVGGQPAPVISPGSGPGSLTVQIPSGASSSGVVVFMGTLSSSSFAFAVVPAFTCQ